MSLIVQKYGGTSVGSLDRIKRVAERIAKTRAAGHDVVAVVSAMSGETDRLLGLSREITDRPLEREVDVLVSSGEQVSASLLAITLNEMGVNARSMMGHQAKVITDSSHTKARIRTIDGGGIREALAAKEGGQVVVVAGFQGIDLEGNITTLGRGGSDTSAVAIAAAVKADVCEIYTDVEGVFTTDPNVCRSARKVDRISFEEMLELASLGAKVLQIRSVELARKYNIPIHVRSSFSDAEGTIVTGEDEQLESVVVAGVAADKKTAKITIRAVPDRPGVAAHVFQPLAEANVSVDMIVQNVSDEGHTDVTFTVSREDLAAAEDTARKLVETIGAKDFVVDNSVVKVSIVGLGMRSHAGVAGKMFKLLADEGINLQVISTSEIKVSCLIEAKYAELAVRVLHDGFGLGDS